MTAPTCVTCGALTYYVAEDRNHYCTSHISDQPAVLYKKPLSPEIVRRARALYLEVLHRSSLEAIQIEDADWEDLDLWFNVGYFWDLNVYTSSSGLLCAVLYKVNDAGQTQLDKAYHIVSDPSTLEVS